MWTRWSPCSRHAGTFGRPVDPPLAMGMKDCVHHGFRRSFTLGTSPSNRLARRTRAGDYIRAGSASLHREADPGEVTSISAAPERATLVTLATLPSATSTQRPIRAEYIRRRRDRSRFRRAPELDQPATNAHPRAWTTRQ